MSAEEYTLQGFLGQGTEAAHFIKAKVESNLGYYIPKSQVRYMSKTRLQDGSVHCVLKVPEWLVTKNNLWELVSQ